MDRAADPRTDDETLAFGPAEGARSPWGRTAAALLALTVMVVVAGVDQRVRDRESAAVDRCATSAVTAARAAWSPVLAMSGYVRPVLDASASASLNRSMYRLVQAAAADAAASLDAATETCRRVDVLPVHGALARRRETCLRALEDQRRFLATLARDGAAITADWPATLTEC